MHMMQMEKLENLSPNFSGSGSLLVYCAMYVCDQVEVAIKSCLSSLIVYFRPPVAFLKDSPRLSETDPAPASFSIF